MTDYRVTLKSNIQSVEVNKKNVKIDCHNAKAGKLVITTLNQNTGIFGGNSYNIADGLTAKDFKVKFDSKEDAQEFYDNLVTGIMNNKSIKTEESQKSGWQNFTAGVKNTVNTVVSNVAGGTATDASTAPAAPAVTPLPDDEKETSSNMPLIIGGAVVLLVVIGLLVWKMKK